MHRQTSPMSGRGEMSNRDRLIAELCEAVPDDDTTGGRAVLLTGPPGIGKSWILERLAKTVHTRGVMVVRLDGSPDKGVGPYRLVVTLLEQIRTQLPETADRVVEAASLVPSVAEALGLGDIPVPVSDDARQRGAALVARCHSLLWSYPRSVEC